MSCPWTEVISTGRSWTDKISATTGTGTGRTSSSQETMPYPSYSLGTTTWVIPSWSRHTAAPTISLMTFPSVSLSNSFWHGSVPFTRFVDSAQILKMRFAVSFAALVISVSSIIERTSKKLLFSPCKKRFSAWSKTALSAPNSSNASTIMRPLTPA